LSPQVIPAKIAVKTAEAETLRELHNMLWVDGARQSTRILISLLLRKLVESETEGVPIEQAAEMLRCSPSQVKLKLDRLLEKAPDHHILVGLKPGRVCFSGNLLVSNTRRINDWQGHVRRLKRSVTWKQVRKLPPPPKTFTMPEATRYLKRPQKQTTNLLSNWLDEAYIGMFMMNDRPIFFGRLF